MRVLLWLVALMWLLFIMGWCVLHGWIVPRIGEFRPRLEAQASRVMGMPVRIGQITARSEGLIPSFELQNVTFLDPQGREALRLPHVLLAVSVSSLWTLGFEQLRVDQPELVIRRTADGKVYVAGMDVSQDRGNSNAAKDWFFSQTEFVIRGGTVRWTDELRNAPSLALTDVDLVVRNSHLRHLMRLDATPPVEWGDRLSLRGLFRQPLLSRGSGNFADWSGQVYAEFARVDAAQVSRHVNLEPLGIDVTRGHGAVRAWANISKGKFTGGTADLALKDVETQLGPALEPLAFDSITGRFTGHERSTGVDFSTERLAFQTREGQVWPGGNISLTHTNAQAHKPEANAFKADKLDLAALALIANRIPLDKATRDLLISLAPSGLVDTLEAHWQGPLNTSQTPTNFAVKGRVANFSMAAIPAVAAIPAIPAVSGMPASVTPMVAAKAGATKAGGTKAGAMTATPGRPGISGAAIDFDFTHEEGHATINIQNGALDLPGIFEEPRVPMDRLTAEAHWKLSGDRIEAQLRNLQFANADAAGGADIAWHTQDTGHAVVSKLSPDHRFPGVLDLQGALSRGNGAKVHRYLPLVLPDEARHYVRDAVVAGQVTDVRFKVKGAISQIPFANPAEGDFHISAKVHHGNFAYVPKTIQPTGALPWPAMTDVDGELVFDRESFAVNGATSKVAGLPGLNVVKVDAKIPNLSHNATVEVNASLNGALVDALGFVNGSPIGTMTNEALAKTVATGMGEYRFRLSLPISTIEKSVVQGTVNLLGNDVQFAPATPQFTKLKGSVAITEHGFTINSAQARMLGGDIHFDGGTVSATRTAATATAANLDASASVVFKAQGNLTAEGLQQASDLGLVPRLARNASGSTAYAATLGFRRGAPEVSFSSTLQGMALNFPAPLSKTAEAALPVRFESALLPLPDPLPGAAGGSGNTNANVNGPLQDQLSLTIGRMASVVYVRDISGPQARVIRGGIGIGLEGAEAVPLPMTGVAANINVARVDIDAWEKILADSAVSGAAVKGDPVNQVSQPAATLSSLESQAYLPTTVAVRVRELVAQGRTLHNLVVGGARDGLTWRANVDATELNGYVEFRQARDVGPRAGPDLGPGRIYARLSRLSLASTAANDVESLLNDQPASIPALDIVVENLDLLGKKLGRVQIDAVNRRVPGPVQNGIREWHLNKFDVTLPEAVLTATGNWVAMPAPTGTKTAGMQALTTTGEVAERRRTTLNFKLDIVDSGELLKRFDMPGLIRGGKGRLEGQVGWVGSPLSLDYPTMNGQLNLNIESGQFIKADPGIAKLLGVLSLQALPRRLALDFRDVFSEGFSFDFVRGDAKITEGLLYTNNLQMSGVNAAVMMEGNADIARETQNLKVVVVPEINAGTASLIATAINPVIGLSSFLAQYFLRRPLMQVATQEFHVDGTWSDPKITKVERQTKTIETPAISH